MTSAYNNLFHPARNWDAFRSTQEELRLGPLNPDFTIDNRSYWKTCKKVALVILKIILFPWILYEGIRYVFQRLAMAALYPAQSSILKSCILPEMKTEALDIARMHVPPNSIVRHIKLVKDGISYSGLLMGSPGTIENGKWVLQATGNAQPVEYCQFYFQSYQIVGYNLLMINGPGVGRSEGTATAESLGYPQEIALSYLEQVIQATRVVLSGFSLGSGAISQAIKEHEFQFETTKYLVIQQMTFDSTANVAHKFLTHRNTCCTSCLAPIAKCIIQWTGLNVDNTDASRRLSELGIPEVIIQAGNSAEFQHDGIIPIEAAHARRVLQESLVAHKYIYRIPNGSHNESTHPQAIHAIHNWQLGLIL